MYETIEFKESTAEVSAKGGSASGGKAGVVSIVAMLNKHGRGDRRIVVQKGMAGILDNLYGSV